MPWRQHGHARVNPRAPDAFAVCDRCNRLWNKRDLIWEMQWRGPRLMKTGFLVCQPCLDVPQQQLRPRILPTDPVPILNPRPEFYRVEDGLQGFTLYTLDPPFGDLTGPVYHEDYVLEQVAALSGIATPAVLLDFSGDIDQSQVAQSLILALTQRDYLLIFNPTSVPLAISFATASFDDPTSIVVNVGQALFWAISQNVQISDAALTVAGFLPGQPYFAWASVGNTGLINDGGVLQLTNTVGYPTNPTGLPPGAVYNNGLAIGIVAGVTPDPDAPPIFFGHITSAQLLADGAGNLPLMPPSITGQLWNNGGEIAVAL